MGHKQDYWERLREALARPIGALVTGTRCTKDSPARFVGYVEMGEEEFEERLHEMGFERNPLSYWKKAADFLGDEEGSWRYVDGDWQIHCVLYDKEHPEDGEEATYVYAHWEYRWDRHPLKHLRAEKMDSPKGVNEMRRHLQMASIPWYNDPSIQ